jgi:murein DD-endopeptidase MepM/ murein hydrolase activator NlpD
MLFKALLPFVLAAALSVQVQGHALITPALGVDGNGVRKDVKRPSGNKPCGKNVDVAGNIDSSTPVVAGADGSVTMTITNFNPYVMVRNGS